MQQAAESAPSPTSPSFAGLLAALAAPTPRPSPAWDDEGLADDVATFSYEHSLRTQTRYKPPEPTDEPQTVTSGSEPAPSQEMSSQAEATADQEAAQSAQSFAKPQSGPARDDATAPDRNLKSASITIRMSQSECAQLRQRAAEAGLTVSAYLRSCTFEAEVLRAQVKETLAQLRSGALASEQPLMAPAPPTSHRSWLRRILSR